MKKGWRVILGIVLVAVILGAVCFGVGMMTGADLNRIIHNLDDQYQVVTYINMYTGYVKQLIQTIFPWF